MELVALTLEAPYIGPAKEFNGGGRTAKPPYLRFICGRALDLGPRHWRVALYWHPDPDHRPYEGRRLWLHGVEVNFSVYLWFHRF